MIQKKSLDSEVIPNDTTSSLVSLRVSYNDADKLSSLIKQLTNRLNQSRGFKSIEVIRREGGLGVDFYTLLRFKSPEALDHWASSPERNEALEPIEELAISDVSRQQASGSNIWFEPVKGLPSAPKPPLLWKRWLLSMLAVYPALIIIINVLHPITSVLPESLAMFVVATILTGLTTSVIVPWLSKTLQSWLSRR